MKRLALGLAALVTVVLACTDDPASPHRSRLLADGGGGGAVGCPTTIGAGEIYGKNFSAPGTYTVTLIPRYRASQPHTIAGSWDSQTAGHGCDATEGDWSWLANENFAGKCPTSEKHAGGTGSEIHCIRPGRFDLDGMPLDWTRYTVNAGNGIYVETLGAMNGNAAGNETDVVVMSGMPLSNTVVPRVDLEFVSDPAAQSWNGAVVGELTPEGQWTDTVTTSSNAAWLRIGAWDALPAQGKGTMLVRYLWSGIDDDSASGYANHESDGAKLARVHLMPQGCGHVQAMFRPASGESRILNIPYRVGPSCTATLTANVSGSGTVSSSPAGIYTTTSASAQFTFGTTVYLSAIPAAGYRFDHWTGCGTPCAITLNASQSATATFVLIPVTINGPDEAPAPGNYSWIAQPNFGQGPYTYQWYKRPSSGGSWTAVGNNRFKLVLTITTPSDFQLRVVVTDATGSYEAIKAVTGYY